MPVVLNCIIRDGALVALKRLRADHLAYIESHLAEILFGGPAHGQDGTPQEMIIVLKTDDVEAGRRFVAEEPYSASGEVFTEIKVRTWSQVVPESAPGALAQMLAAERKISKATPDTKPFGPT